MERTTKIAKEEEWVPHAAATVEERAVLKSLWETLNDANKKEFEQQILTDDGIKKMIEFASKFTGE